MGNGRLPQRHFNREAIHYYQRPELVNLSFTNIIKDPFPTPQEAEILLDLFGTTQTAFVPLRIVNEEKKTVTAALIGERGDTILVSFPPTNFGQTTFSARRAALERIVV